MAGSEEHVRQQGRLALIVLLGAFGSFALDLSPGPLGFALFAGAAASILTMALLGWTADRLGRQVS